MPPSLPLRSLGVVVTSACNLSCAYCYQNAKRADRIAWSDLRSALDLALHSTSRAVRIAFTGGEPLVEFELIRRAVAYVADHRPPALGVRFHLYTNGVALGPREAAFLDAHRFSIQLSHDGVEAAQDVRARGTFQRLDRLLLRLRADHPSLFRQRFHVAAVLLPETVHLLRQSVRYFLHRGIRDVALAPAAGVAAGRWTDAAVRELDRQLDGLTEDAVRRFRRDGEIPLRLFRGAAPGSSEAAEPVRGAMCGLGSLASLVVDATGRLSGCLPLVASYQRFPGTELGRRVARVRLPPVSRFRGGADVARYRARLRETFAFDRRDLKRSSYGRCRECRYASECSVCPMMIVLQPEGAGPNIVPDYLCAFNRLAEKHRRRFLRERRPPRNRPE